jgi:F-type H+-transporting ATPase subunit a
MPETNGSNHAPEAVPVHEETAAAAHSPLHISLKAEEIFDIGGFPVTNSLILSAIVLALLGGIALSARRKMKLIPGMFQSVFEFFVESLLELMDTIYGERAKSERYFPIIATIFLFVLFSNWFGLLPLVGSLVVHLPEGTTPLLRAPSADLNFTLALAIVAVVTINVLGAAAIGAGKHLSKFFNFKGPIDFFIGLIELVSEAAKMVSFSFRLFGNVFAGEVLLIIIGYLAPYVVPIPFLFLEIFVGFVQALIFSMLSIVFIAIAVVDHSAHDDHAPAPGHAHS